MKDGEDVIPTPVTDKAWDLLADLILDAPLFHARVMGLSEDRVRPVDVSRLFALAEQAMQELHKDDRHSSVGPYATLLLEKDELESLLTLLTAALDGGLDPMLNSLRTALAEARISLEVRRD